MLDRYGRSIEYMRISITDRCNLRCVYCMPDGVDLVPMREILTYEEIREICSAGAALGIRTLKITGGEPLVRRGCADLVRSLKTIHGIEQVTMTTNGVLLNEEMVDFARPVTFVVDGKSVTMEVVPLMSVLEETTAERGDPNYQFEAEISSELIDQLITG